MSNCLNINCGKELVHTSGRRPKKYCDAICRNVHYKVLYPANVVKVKDPVKIPSWITDYYISHPEKLRSSVINNPSELERDNKFINAARGRDASGINEDELREVSRQPGESLIDYTLRKAEAEGRLKK
jgi:hypothetical protein